MTCDILITNAVIYTGGTLPQTIGNGYVAVKDGLISRCGAMNELPGDLRAVKHIDAAGGLVMPGLVNGHTHGAMTLFRGLADDLPLMTWLNDHIFPAEARFVTAEMVYWCSKLAAAEMLLAGTTTVADGYFYEHEAARAFGEAGMRAVAAHGVIDFPAPGVPDPADNVEAAARFVEKWQGDSLIVPAFFCHSPYTCSPETLVKAKSAADKAGALFFIHAAETRSEVNQIKDLFATTPIRYLDRLGILDSHTVCVHGVWLDDEEISLLAERGCGVITCPESNMKLASGTARVAEMLAAGISVGLGTDGCASNNDLDLFGEMDCCAKLHKLVQADPTVLPARDVVRMATSLGARALGLGDKIGELASGKKADLILLDTDKPHLTPTFQIDSMLVYAAGGADVDCVIVNGRLVVENRQILSFDLQECLAMVRGLARQVRATI